MSDLTYVNITEELAPRCEALELLAFQHADPEELISAQPELADAADGLKELGRYLLVNHVIGHGDGHTEDDEDATNQDGALSGDAPKVDEFYVAIDHDFGDEYPGCCDYRRGCVARGAIARRLSTCPLRQDRDGGDVCRVGARLPMC